MKKYIILTLVLIASFLVQAQNPQFEFVKFNQGYQGDASGMTVSKDLYGNIYLQGGFTGSVDFNPSLTQAYWLTATTTGPTGYNRYIQKLDSNGNFIWVRSFYFSYGGMGLKGIDSNGDLIFSGGFKDSVDIDPGINTHMLYSHGEMDVFILKLSANGNFVWAKSFGGSDDDVISDLVIDPQGNIFAHGTIKDTVDFDPGSGTCTCIAGNDAFVLKLNKNGDFVWAKTFHGSEGYSDGIALDLDSEGNVYCTGNFFGNGLDFDPGPGITGPPANSSLMYFVKLDSLGNFVWARFNTAIYIGQGSSMPRKMALDRLNNIFITGITYQNIDFDPGPDTLLLAQSTFIEKYDQNGNFLWAKSYGYGDQPLALATDTFGNVYSTGLVRDSTDLDPGPDTLIFYARGPGLLGYSGYIQKLNQHGELIWAGVIDGSMGSAYCYDMIVDESGNVFAVGLYAGTKDFDISSGVQNNTSINYQEASYLLKLSQCKTITTDYQTSCDSLTWMDGVTYYKSTNSAYFTLPSAAGCDSVICLNLNIPNIDTTLTVSTTGIFSSNQGVASYQWLDCNNGYAVLVGDTLQSLTPTLNGSYAVEINLNGCIDTSDCMQINNVSIHEIEGAIVKLYPNPNKGSFTLDLGNAKADEIRILNSLGQEILVLQNANSQYFNLDLKPGVYFVQIRTQKGINTVKFVVK